MNAKHHEREAKIIAEAGKTGAITIATNMAGRGTAIQLGGNKNFLVCFWNKRIKNIIIKNKIKGIRFPDKIIPAKKIIKKIGIKNLEKVFDNLL